MSQRSSRLLPTPPTPVGPSPIDGVLLVERFERPAGHRFTASSLPGHLLHVIVRGRVAQTCNGRPYLLRPRTAIWYHEDETVTGEVLAPWEFYSVNFLAPALPPPAFSERLHTLAWPRALECCRQLHAAWRAPADAERRTLAVHAALQALLLCLAPRPAPVALDARARLWWTLEARLREDLARRWTLPELAALAQASRAAVERSCHHATGRSPLRRLAQVRVSLARGLLAHPDLSVSAIAARLGYPRVHELSRAIHRAYGVSPTALRERDRGERAAERPRGRAG